MAKRFRRAKMDGDNKVTKNLVRSMVRNAVAATEEEKFYIHTQGVTNGVTAGIVIPITQGITQGDDVNQRTGAKLLMKQIEWNCNVILPALGLVGSMRLIVFADRDNIGVLPAVTDVLNAASVTSGPQLLNYSQKRFKVLYDVTHPLVVAASNQEVNIHKFLKARMPVHYAGPTSATASNHRNAVFILAITDLGANPPFYAWDAVVHYSDA